jgi:uncharacterized protein YqhQ
MAKPAVGGQAVIEGVLMMNDNKLAIAVRKPNKKISIKKETLNSFIRTHKFFKLPLIRGIFMLLDTLVVGIKALTWSANEAIEEDTTKKNNGKISPWELTWTLILSIGGAVGLFVLLPLWLTKLVTSDHGFWFNLYDGLIRLGIFFAYVYIIGLMKDVRRVFQYHGAEHKAVNCFESKDKLTVANVLKHSRFHPRCGTTFIFIVLIISILVFSLFILESWWAKLGIRLIFIPIIASVSYEILRLGGKYYKNKIVRAIVFPGLCTQWFTTREPDADQVEVAIKSLKAVI